MELLTAQEQVEQIEYPEVIWINGLDLMKHCLKQDKNQTIYQDQSPSTNAFIEWTEAIQEKSEVSDKDYNTAYANDYLPEKAYKPFSDEQGDFQADDFLNGDKKCFEVFEQTRRAKPALSLLLDIAVPASERTKSYMIERQQKVYRLVAEAESENRPCQVVGVLGVHITERKVNLKIFIIIKDYHDPIFPAIWGGLKNNKSTNGFCNVIMDYFIGTHDSDNGGIRQVEKAGQYFENDELRIFGNKITE